MHFSEIKLAERLNWTDLNAAKRLLADMAGDPPAALRQIGTSLAGHRTVEVVYDTDDRRVVALTAVRDAWFQMAEAYSMLPDRFDDLDAEISAAVARYEAKEARVERFVELLREGICMREARQMAGLRS